MSPKERLTSGVGPTHLSMKSGGSSTDVCIPSTNTLNGIARTLSLKYKIIMNEYNRFRKLLQQL